MSQEQILQKINTDIRQGSIISHHTLGQLRKFFEQAKNMQLNNTAKPQQLYAFKEKVIGHFLTSLSDTNLPSKQKMIIFEILERDLVSSKHNIALFNKLYNCLQNDDENVAIQASKTIDALIKQINENKQVTPSAVPLQMKAHYIKLFQFLKEKTEFLLRLYDNARNDPDFKIMKRQVFDQRQRDRQNRQQRQNRQREKKEIVFKNSKSLKFINQVPHLFIHLMAYVDTSNNRAPEDQQKVKMLIRKSIQNIIQALRKTPYEDFYNEFNYDFNNELFGVMTKLLQFLFINLKNDNDRRENQSSVNLRQHISQQIGYINVPQVIKNFIHLLKNCSQDFQLNRYEIVNRLKLLLNNLDKNKLNKRDVQDIMNDILNEEVILGKKKILGQYSKNAIYSYWIQIIKSPVLYSHIFPPQLLLMRNFGQQGNNNQSLTEDSPQIAHCFKGIERLIEEILKTIFDNTIYPSVQQKSIQVLIFLVEQMFPDGNEAESVNIINTVPVARKIHQNKLTVLLRILNCVSLKFQSIKNIFQQINQYVTSKLGRTVTKADLPQTSKLDYMNLNSLKISIQQTPDWDQKAVQFIQDYDSQIDSSLLTLTAAQNKFLTIYQQEDQLCFNSHPIRITNYTFYMKEVKTKLLEKFIALSQKITKIFLNLNVESYTNIEVNQLKAIYFIVPNKKSLKPQQCSILAKILKNGLRIFEILHIYDLHSDDQTSKKGHLKNFMLIFAQIYDPVNFRDIFQPNMDGFFRNLITYAKYCADYCLQFVLIQPYCSSNNNQSNSFNKNIVQLLIYNLILRLQSTSDQLDPFHEFYTYKQEYFSLLQKLIRFPFRCLSRYADDSFIRNYFRQIILFLIKKAHSSRFCLDYLHLMRTLFKNILFNSSRQAASPLFSQFYAICCKGASQQPVHSVFINVNILDNFNRLFDTGIPQLADIVTQLIIMLPLKSKHIIQFAKQGYIVKPLLHCLCLMSDYNYTLRTLKTFQIIISHSTSEQINQFLQGLKDKLINRLFQIVSECKLSTLRTEKISNDLSSLSLKLLAKLGSLSRNREVPYSILPKNEEPSISHNDLVLSYTDLKNGNKNISSMLPCIQFAIDSFNKLLNSYYQSLIGISMETVETCFNLLQQALPVCLEKMDSLSEKILTVFSCILSLSSKNSNLNISQSILTRIRDLVKKQIIQYAQNIKKQLVTVGLNDYSRFFIKCLIQNLNERVLITREDNFIKQISQEPKAFLWGLIKGMINAVQQTKTNSHSVIYHYIIKLLLSQVVILNNPNHTKLNPYQDQYNHVLPYKNAALNVLSQIIDTTPQQVLQDLYPEILESAFVAILSVPDILNLKIMQHPRNIARKIYKFMLRNEEQFLKKLQTDKGQEVFSSILEYLVGHSEQCHYIAKMLLQMIMNQTNLNLHEILYGGVPWQKVCDTESSQTQCQSKFPFNQFQNKQMMKCPLVPLIRNLIRIVHYVNKDSLENNQKRIRTLTNAFSTMQLLISLKSRNYPNKTFQAFTILSKQNVNQDFVDENIIFHQTFKKLIAVASQTIEINGKLFDSYTKIITQQPNPQQNVPGQIPANLPNNQPPTNLNQNAQNPRIPPIVNNLNRAREPIPNLPNPALQGNQNFNINTNTFIDDEQYGLNIDDLDMDVKVWGQLISSILRFLKTVLINDVIFQVSKNILKKKIDKSKVTQTRLQVIFTMFQLIGRVDRNVRATAYQCLKQLLSKQEHPKDLIQNDQKLKHILRPVLISLQLDFKKFTPSFLHMFRKILKLLTQCFNITLIQKLVDKLKQMEKVKEQQGQIKNQQQQLQQGQVRPMNYSQITTQVKCIANFLGLFQYLAYAYHNHRYVNYTINSIMDIYKHVISIAKFFAPRLGKQTVATQIQKTLAKVLNTMAQKLSGQSIFMESNNRRQFDLQNFLDVLKMQDSFPLRQRLTRDTSYIDKVLAQYQSSSVSRKNYLLFLEIIYTLAKFNGTWLQNSHLLAQRLYARLQIVIQSKLKRTDQRQQIDCIQKNQFVILTQILLRYIQYNKDQIDLLFNLMKVFKVRSTFDLHFLRKYLRYKLYDNLTPQLRKKIVINFFNLLQKHYTNDTEKILAISQNIIYYMILKQTSIAEESERSILINDEEILKTFSETVKNCLTPKHLAIRNANNYRVAIQLLQLSNLALGTLKNILQQNYRNNMLPIVWGLLRIEDKMIKNYAFVWTSNYIRVFDGFQHQKALGLYLTLIKGLEGLNQGDYEIGALIKKALNVLIPYWDSRPQTDSKGSRPNSNWIDWSLRAVHQENNQPSRLVRFWEIVVKNHKIFHKFKNKFETQMVNSMQWLMVANNPTSGNPLVKKIASDMSFIYIQWKFLETKLKMKDKQPSQRLKVLEESVNDKAAQICLNFFIKVALNNCTDRDDKQIMKRSLFLLKKTLILWPQTKKKFESIRTIVNKLKNNTQAVQNQSAELPLRFHYTLLNIINILLMYETDNKMITQLVSIFKLLQLGQINQIRMPIQNPNPAAQPPTSTIFTMNNVYLLYLLCNIIKRLASVAMQNEREQQSTKLLQQINQCIREGFQNYVMAANRGRSVQGQPINRNPQTRRIQIEVAISFLKIMFQLDPKSIDQHLNYIKQVASSLKKMFEKGFQSSKTNTANRVYQLPNLVQGSFNQMIQKDFEINVQLIKKDQIQLAEDNYEKDVIKSYVTRRPLFVILLRILAAKFNSIPHSQDQSNVLELFLSIYQKISDPQLKIEVINIMKCLFIGPQGFSKGIVPQRYQSIKKISYPVNKIFFLLFEDNSKFYQHFQSRKNRANDQNYTINQRIYQEITTKTFFQFLCMFICQLNEINPQYREKIKIFVLYAIKVVDKQHLHKLFEIIDQSYSQNPSQLYTCLFEDYKQLNCAEEYMQGDQIMLFFTSFLYWKATRNVEIQPHAYRNTLSNNFSQYYQRLLRSEYSSSHQINHIRKTLKVSTQLLPTSKKLPKVLQEYLIYGSYQQVWGSTLLNMAIQLDNLSPQQLYFISTKIKEWGSMLKILQNSNSQGAKQILDYLYKIYSDKDVLYGFRMAITKSPQLRNSLIYLQQRKYTDSFKLALSSTERSKNQNKMIDEDQLSTLEEIDIFGNCVDASITSDIYKECYKNLNQWDMISSDNFEEQDSLAKIDFLFHSSGDVSKIQNIVTYLDNTNNKQFPFFYGRALLNFLEYQFSPNKQLNVALLYSLIQWMCFPKNAKHKQNQMLIQIECLLELQQGQKIKEESTHQNNDQSSLVDALTKVVQAVYTQINTWRQRMPHKYQSPQIWHAILGQRNIVYENMKKRMTRLLQGIQTPQPFNVPKLLIPYTDIQWNVLRNIKQSRNFGIYQLNKIPNSNQLYMDQVFMKQKQSYYYHLNHEKNSLNAIKQLDFAINNTCKEQPGFKIDLLRLKGKLLSSKNLFSEANTVFKQGMQIQSHYPQLWKDWMMTCLKAYQTSTNNKKQWALSSISLIPDTLRYKTSKTRLLIPGIFSILNQFNGDQQVSKTFSNVIEQVPAKAFLLWIPQLIKLSQQDSKIKETVQKIMQKLSFAYPQSIYFAIKPFVKLQQLKVVRDVYIKMKRVSYNLMAKLDIFCQISNDLKNQNQKISLTTIGAWARRFTEIHIPLYQNYKGELDLSKIPYIQQLSEKIQTDILNGQEGKVITILGSDNKQYKFRIQKQNKSQGNSEKQTEFENAYMSQNLQIINSYLKKWRQSARRGIKLQQVRKMPLQQDYYLIKTSSHMTSLKDILDNYMQKNTSFPIQYPDNDKSFLILPKSEINKTINKRMRQIVPESILKEYFMSKALAHEDFMTFRKMFSLQYASVLAFNYLFSINTNLENIFVDMKTGSILLHNSKFSASVKQLSPYSVRISRNIKCFLSQIYINGGVLPSFVASIESLTNQKLNYKSYLKVLFEDLDKVIRDKNYSSEIETVYERVKDISSSYEISKKIMEAADFVTESSHTPYQYKYWF